MPLTARATAGAQRCDSVSVTEGASPSSNPAGSPPRKPNTAWLGSPAISASSAPAASTRTRRAACGSSCWASSTNSTRIRSRSAASNSGSTANASSAAPTSSAAPSAGAVACGAAVPDRRAQQHHLLVLPGELAGGDPFRPPAPRPSRCSSAGSTPRSAQRASRFRSSVGEAGGAQRGPQLRRPSRRGARPVLEVAGQQFPDDGVLFGAGDQPRRRIAGAFGGPPQDRVRVAVHGPHQRLADGGPAAAAARERSNAVVNALRLGHPDPAGTGKQQNRFRVDTGVDLGDRGVDQQAALAGAGPTEDTQPTTRTELQDGVRFGIPHVGHDGMTSRGSDRSSSARPTRPAPTLERERTKTGRRS